MRGILLQLIGDVISVVKASLAIIGIARLEKIVADLFSIEVNLLLPQATDEDQRPL